jgi:GNAT superfamily N-acetyltransferase
MAGRELAVAEINEFWEAWAPSEVAQRMSTVAAPWYVAAGWALELFTGDAARGHDDLEIAVPAVRFGEVMTAFPGFDWYVVGDGQQRLLPRSDDIAVVAADAVGIGVGAIWTFLHNPPLLVSDCVDALPEIGIAVTPAVRGNGVGSALLDELFVRSTGKYEALRLNVHERNPAKQLYERKGFRSVGRGRWALGIAMLKDLR